MSPSPKKRARAASSSQSSSEKDASDIVPDAADKATDANAQPADQPHVPHCPQYQDADDEINELAMDLFYQELRKRFRNVRIHVDEFNRVPKHVWYQQEGQETLSEDCKYTLNRFSSSLGGAMQEFLDKFRNPTEETHAYLELIDLHVDHLTQFLILDDSKCSPTWIRSPRKHRLIVDDPLRTLGLTYEAAAVVNFVKNLRVAFTEDMNNSVGCRGLESILEYACKVAFGHDFSYKSPVQVIELCSSACDGQCLIDGFPINVVESAHVANNFESFGLQSGVNDLTPHCAEDCNSPSKSISSNESKNKYMNPDIVVTSVHDKDGTPWVKFLLVCEIRNGYEEFSITETAQLVRKMAAACMHQSEVFGLLINAGFAKLARLQHHPEKKLTCDDLVKDQYMFATHEMDSEDNSFQGSELKRLIRDLAAVFDYANEKICKVKLVSDPPPS